MKSIKEELMEDYKREFLEKILDILSIIAIVIITSMIVLFVIEFKEMLNDHRCYTLPLNEFYQDTKCEKYWNIER